MTFEEWKIELIENFKVFLDSEFDNQDNLTFLLGTDDTLLKEYTEGIPAKLHAQLTWADYNLQYEAGREIFLIPNHLI